MSQEDVEVVRALFDAYREQDVDTVLEMVDPDIEVRPSIAGGPEGTVYRGLDGFRQFLANVEAAWADFRIETEEFYHLGNTVLVLGRSFARGEGSGVLVEANTGWVCGVRQGKVHRFRSFTSREEALEAVGLKE
jgi:ketosteroid isomerase-like protein